MKYLKYILLFLPIFLLLSGCSRIIKQVEINQSVIDVEAVSQPQEQYSGLSNRKSLCSNCGMLFIIRPDSSPEFVMRNMNFPLDFIWINNGIIIDLTLNAQPEGEAPQTIYQAILPVDYVLEVNAGTVEQFGWHIGDTVKFIYD